MKKLVIVESPTKAKTINKFLGNSFIVESSFGHVRDLPKSKMGIDIDNDFEPTYVIPKKAQKQVTKLKKDAKKADEIILATDEDREGEAIAWHLQKILKTPDEKMKRIAFHEITKEAILEALENPRNLDKNLVDAQQARRILDRLVGYELSPFLWKKVAKGLSAGRVQSVAVRLIVEREREIEKFKAEEYWTIEGIFKKQMEFRAKLHEIDGKKIDKLDIKNKKEATVITKELEGENFLVSKVEKKEKKKNPYAPFTTSTLQQDANHKLGFSAKKTMMLAQQLYEGVEIGKEGQVGLITYMRTDSLNLSDKFLNGCQNYLKKELDKKYSLEKPRRFKTKSKGAQEAHEAIRPTNIYKNPEELKDFLSGDQYKLYDLIWRRALASQMPPAILDSTAISIKNENEKYTFRASGSIIKFDGFLKIYKTDTKETTLPDCAEGNEIDCLEIIPEQHFTEPPARYSDATLVKALEEYEIGRPSTYAPTISTIIERGYVERIEGRKLKPKEIAFLVNDLLVKHFPKIVDYKFTAKMENDLDDIAAGEKKWVPIIREFYMPFKQNLNEKYEEVSKKELTEEETDEICEKCGQPMVIKMGRFGKFLACSGFPECKNTKDLNKDGEETKEEKKFGDVKCDKCGGDMEVKRGRFGKFLGCSNYPDCKNIKPIEEKTGVKCPECEKGDIVEKRSKRGRTFYACNQYPDCKFALWSKPTGEKCKLCESLMVYGKKDTTVCSNKECENSK